MSRLALLRSMLAIRAFEDALAVHPECGFQLLSSGEEALAVGVCAALTSDDQLLSSGRSIGPALARGLDPGAVMAELLGRATGPCKGKGGRGHLAQPSAGFFGAHAVVGGNLSIAAGVALAMQVERRPGIVVCIFGDGACGAGALHETLNLAALWKLPLLFACDNNGWSISTPRARALAPRRLSDLATPFGIPAVTVDGMDVLAVRDATQRFAERARAGEGPAFLEGVTERFATHSTATRETRSADEMAAIRARCPIRRLAATLERDGELDAAGLARLERDAADAALRAVRFAEASPPADIAEIARDVA
ncbi:MAG: thiamine pyrophosphate-dependent dehydrogenase E1 component subunit alpha [Betaproteobacteria bacterium]